MAQINRSDLKAYSRSLIVESQTSEEVTPEEHNLVNDEMIDSVLNAIDDLAGPSDFETPVPTTKKYINPYQAFLNLLRKSDKATTAEIAAGLNDAKYITPKGLRSVVGRSGIEITDSAKRNLLQDNDNWENPARPFGDPDTEDKHYPVYSGTAIADQYEHDYYIGTDNTTLSIYKYELINMSGILTPIRIPLVIK